MKNRPNTKKVTTNKLEEGAAQPKKEFSKRNTEWSNIINGFYKVMKSKPDFAAIRNNIVKDYRSQPFRFIAWWTLGIFALIKGIQLTLFLNSCTIEIPNSNLFNKNAITRLNSLTEKGVEWQIRYYLSDYKMRLEQEGLTESTRGVHERISSILKS